jgi:hypothetical protein
MGPARRRGVATQMLPKGNNQEADLIVPEG